MICFCFCYSFVLVQCGLMIKNDGWCTFGKASKGNEMFFKSLFSSFDCVNDIINKVVINIYSFTLIKTYRKLVCFLSSF